MKFSLIFLQLSLSAVLLHPGSGSAENRQRTELWFPNLPGLVTLRCDLHMHTVFSDGDVWPTVRVQEAWRDGLDAIALTDHIEYLRYKQDIPVNYGRATEVARTEAESLGIILIGAAEITRGEPPGHLNTLFVTNVAALKQDDYRAALNNAFAQGAFIFWNHPGWQQPGGKSVWYAQQGEFLEKGWLRGIEIVNGSDYDPIAHQWCRDKKLTLVAGSDIHGLTSFEYAGTPEDFRPVTLVFAKTRSSEGIKEALQSRRSAVFSKGRLIGEPEYLEPLFQGSIEILTPELRIQGKGRALMQIRNKSPLNLELRLTSKGTEIGAEEHVVLQAGKVSAFSVRCTSDRAKGTREVALPCKVVNLLVAPDTGLSTTLPLKITFR